MSKNKEDLVWLLVILVVLLVVLSLPMWGLWGGYMPGMMSMMGYGWGFMFLIPLVFLMLIALGAYYIITELAGHGRSEHGGNRGALDILRERYAKGEITREQYLKMREELES